MTEPQNLEEGQTISIDADPLSGLTFRVESVEVEDIGITETFALALSTDSESLWSIVGTTSDNVHTISKAVDNTKQSYRITSNAIVLE